MKKILIKQCLQCDSYDGENIRCRELGIKLMNPYQIPTDCPLEDEVDNWIPVTRIHERIKVLRGKNIDPEIMIARIDELKLLLRQPLPTAPQGEKGKK